VKPERIGQTFSLGPQQWRVDARGNWQVLMFGWWPGHTGQPAYRWSDIDIKRVPQELKDAVAR